MTWPFPIAPTPEQLAQLQAPPIDEDVDVSGVLPWMPLDIAALDRSTTWGLACRLPFAAGACINLWRQAWREVPAGSLPNDSAACSVIAGVSQSDWNAIASVVMRNFVLHCDGRLYHDTIVGMALTQLGKLQKRSKAARAGAKGRWGKKKTLLARAMRDRSGSDAETMPVDATKSESEKEGISSGGGAHQKLTEAEALHAFAEWYAFYPRKVGKLAAQRAFLKIIHGAKSPGLHALAEGLERSCADWRARNTPDDKIPHPATWLNGGRWTDETGGAGARGKPQHRSSRIQDGLDLLPPD